MEWMRLRTPSLVTFTSLLCGISAIGLAIEGQEVLAGGLLLAGYLLDAIDGELARRLKVMSDFGLQLDSIVDIVVFGAGGAVLVAQHVRSSQVGGLLIWVMAGVYVVAGAYRLARFNLMAGRSKPSETYGLTISTSGAFVTLSVLADRSHGGPHAPGWVFLIVLGVAAALMVSHIRFPELRTVLRNWRVNVVILGTCGIIAIWLQPQVVWWAVTTGYISFGVARALVRQI
jgi:CDP-diacylglycerol--serine O-phosphatidyltransferase